MSVLKFFSLKRWQKEGHLCTESPPGLWLPEPRGHEASQCYFIVTFSKTGCFIVKLLWLLLYKSMFEIQAISMARSARRRYAVKQTWVNYEFPFRNLFPSTPFKLLPNFRRTNMHTESLAVIQNQWREKNFWIGIRNWPKSAGPGGPFSPISIWIAQCKKWFTS